MELTMEVLQGIVVMVLVAAAAWVTVRHVVRQFSTADSDFSGSAGCAACPAMGKSGSQTSIRGKSTRRRARIS